MNGIPAYDAFYSVNPALKPPSLKMSWICVFVVHSTYSI